MSTNERDLFSEATASAPVQAQKPRTLIPSTSAPSERQLMSLSGQPTPPAPPTAPAQTMQTMAATAPPGQPAPTSAPAPGTTTTPVVSTPVLSQVQGNETVAGQLESLLKSGSPLLEQAKNRSIVESSSRGLQNSSIASQAGEQALISAAVPIAATDAATYSQRAQGNQTAQNQFGQAQQQFEHQGQLNTQDHLQRLVEQAQAGDINSRLQLEQAGYNSSLSAQENVQRLEQLSREGDIQATLSLQQFNQATMLAAQAQGFAIDLSSQQFQQNQQLLVSEYAQRGALSSQEAAQEITRLNQQHENTLREIEAQVSASGSGDAAKWTRDLQQGYLNAVTQRQMAASQEIAAIYSTQGVSGAQQTAAVVTAQNRLRSDLVAIASYFQQTPGWPTTSTGAPAPAPGFTPTPGVPSNPYNTPPSPPYVPGPPYVRPPSGPGNGGRTTP
jgi:hypothetical protein